MSDLIDRQVAIDAIKDDKLDLTNPNVVAVFKATGDFEKAETQVMTCDRHIKILKDLPPAQPQRIRAKWIATTALQEGQITWRDYKCSNCSHHRGKPMNYCEVCGAKMER